MHWNCALANAVKHTVLHNWATKSRVASWQLDQWAAVSTCRGFLLGAEVTTAIATASALPSVL